MSVYYTLVVSLPWLPEQMLKCKELPLSRIALDKRLTLLDDIDQQQLALAERLYHQDIAALWNGPDRDLVTRWQRQLDTIHSQVIRERITVRLELQTLLAALRYRQRSDTSAEHFRGFGRWTEQIRRHWQEPLFGLEERIPYLSEMGPLFQQGLSGDLQEQLDAFLWQDLLRSERSHHFSLETVVCFVLRWGLAEKRLLSDADQALAHFESMSAELLDTSGIQRQLEQRFEEFS